MEIGKRLEHVSLIHNNGYKNRLIDVDHTGKITETTRLIESQCHDFTDRPIIVANAIKDTTTFIINLLKI